MKKYALLAALMFTAMTAQAHDNWAVGISLGNPYPVAPPVRYYAPPPAVYYAPPVSYYSAPPVVTYGYPGAGYGVPNVGYRNMAPNVIQFSYGRNFQHGHNYRSYGGHHGHHHGHHR